MKEKAWQREKVMWREADVWHSITRALHRLWERRQRRRAYVRYMRSAQWQMVRAEVMRRACGQCELCGAPAVSVHHKIYRADLFDTRAYDCEALCAACHRRAHRRKK
jgi:5-methylcytosine-specific restriction endonuclease McrA